MDVTTDSEVHGQHMHRSPKSMEFESLWKSLPRQQLIPHKRDFNPARAGSLLKYLMLVDVQMVPTPALPVRLVGGEMSERIQRDIRGRDYLEFLAHDRRADAVRTLHLMLDHPCGLWQIMPFHYERGIAENVEATVFPLLGDAAPFLLALVLPRQDFVRPLPSGDRALFAEGASEFEFLDVGAGVPDWPVP